MFWAGGELCAGGTADVMSDCCGDCLQAVGGSVMVYFCSLHLQNQSPGSKSGESVNYKYFLVNIQAAQFDFAL